MQHLALALVHNDRLEYLMSVQFGVGSVQFFYGIFVYRFPSPL
jgi:hypothetical protein